ncbi:MAG: hypothetical protein J5666_08715 [Bacilli bacterium]|nr:hypothetical protein [Bacilli bacterium]
MIDLNNIYMHGRYILDSSLHIYNTGSGIEFNVCANFLSIKMKAISNQQDKAWMRVIIDNDYDNALELKFSSLEEFVLLDSKKEEVHNFKVLKVSEAIESYVDITNIELKGHYLDKPVYDKTFLVYGDSTVSAYGNLGKLEDEKTLFDTDGLLGYCYLTCKEFKASMNSVNGSGWGVSFSPWTTPKRRPLLKLYDKVAPLSSLSYDMKNINPTLAIISLGTNDSYYIIEGEENKTKNDLIKEFKNDYQKLLANIKKDFNDIPIIMVYGVMKERHNYQVMQEIYEENCDKYNLYQACIEGDGLGVSSHPTYLSHKKISEELIKLIKEILNEK